MTITPEQIDETVRRGQTVAGALIVGVVTAAVVMVVVAGAPQPAGDLLILPVVSAVAAVIAVLASSLVPVFVKPQSDAALNDTWMTQIIVRLAICEGAAFLNLVSYVIEQQWWSLAIVGGLLFWMLTLFPTRTRLRNFLETHQAFEN